jgi:hypothetical protein
VPSLDEAVYPVSLEALLRRFDDANGQLSDSSSEMSDTVLSVNNCLLPSNPSRIRLHRPLDHSREASPVHFFEGYDETYTYEDTMARFVSTFFGVGAEAAARVVADCFALYDAAQPLYERKGHCLQLVLPHAAVRAFAYPCVHWGRPVRLFVDADARLHAKPWQPSAAGDIDLVQLLRERAELGELQSRIIAHPNLFLEHGAFCNVFHGNPDFDAERFSAQLSERLAPLFSGLGSSLLSLHLWPAQ